MKKQGSPCHIMLDSTLCGSMPFDVTCTSPLDGVSVPEGLDRPLNLNHYLGRKVRGISSEKGENIESSWGQTDIRKAPTR